MRSVNGCVQGPWPVLQSKVAHLGLSTPPPGVGTPANVIERGGPSSPRSTPPPPREMGYPRDPLRHRGAPNCRPGRYRRKWPKARRAARDDVEYWFDGTSQDREEWLLHDSRRAPHRLRDALRKVEERPPTWPHSHVRKGVQCRYDFIFVSDDFRVRRVRYALEVLEEK
jgi:hypothetical protein